MNERQISFREAIREGVAESLADDKNLIVLGDIAKRRLPPLTGFETTLAGLKERFPERIVTDFPLVEDMLVGMGLGMSIGGLKSIVSLDHAALFTLLMDDLYRAAIWRYRMAEKEGPSMVLRLGHEILIGRGAEFSTSFLSLVFHLPNLWIATPGTPYHAKGLMKAAINAKRPVVFWEHKNIYEVKGRVPEASYEISFGTSSLFKTGNDVTIVAWSYMSRLALEAAGILAEKNIDAEIVVLHTINPMDLEGILASAEKTSRVVIVEEDMLRGGIGAEISARISEKMPSCRIRRVASKNVPLPEHPRYEKSVLPNTESIVRTCRDLAEGGL